MIPSGVKVFLASQPVDFRFSCLHLLRLLLSLGYLESLQGTSKMLDKTPYIPSLSPYQDFVLISGPASSHTERRHSGLLRIPEEGATMIISRNFGNIRTSIMSCAEEGLYSTKDSGILFSGFGQKSGVFFYGNGGAQELFQSGAFRLEERSVLAMPSGNYSFAMWNGRSITLACDPFGLSLLFYVYTRDGGIIVSNSYHLVLLTLFATEGQQSANIPIMQASLFGRSNFFNQNFSHRMPVEGVYQLPVNKYITITERGADVLDYPSVICALEPSGANINELLDDAAHEIVENVRAVYDSHLITSPLLDLTGGQDSRLVFAAVSHLGRDYLEKVRLNVEDSGSQDLEIACGIANHYSCEFYHGNDREYWRRSPSQITAHWRSAKMGLYYRSGGNSRSAKGTYHDLIGISGGCGEVARGFWTTILRRHLNGNPSEDEFIDRFCSREFAGSGLSLGQIESIKETLSCVLLEIPGDSLRDKLDLHYFFFRNRLHFGLRQYASFHEKNIWSPLASLSMLKASRSMPEHDREWIIIKLTERLDGVLPYFEYDGGLRLAEIPNPLGGQLGRARSTMKMDCSTDRWEQARSISKKRLQTATVVGRLSTASSSIQAGTLPEQQRIEARYCLAALAQNSELGITDENYKILIENLEGQRRRFVFSKITSVYDQLAFTEQKIL